MRYEKWKSRRRWIGNTLRTIHTLGGQEAASRHEYHRWDDHHHNKAQISCKWLPKTRAARMVCYTMHRPRARHHRHSVGALTLRWISPHNQRGLTLCKWENPWFDGATGNRQNFDQLRSKTKVKQPIPGLSNTRDPKSKVGNGDARRPNPCTPDLGRWRLFWKVPVKWMYRQISWSWNYGKSKGTV